MAGVVARDALKDRVLLQMQFHPPAPSNPSSSQPNAISSLSTLPASHPPSKSANDRFSVRGNAVITGGGGNLALVGARALLEHGAGGVALLDLCIAETDEGIQALKKDFEGRRIVVRKIDVCDEVEVGRVIGEVGKLMGGVHILCCYAGIVTGGHSLDVDAATFRRQMDVNATGTFICAQAAARLMVEQKTGGSIVLIASISGHMVNFPQPQVAYNTSKAAVLHIKNSLAAEWARYGIRVNSISPGYMDTILNEGDGLEVGRRLWLSRNPMGRLGDPTELTGPLILLASEAGSYLNGADLLVDGGSHLCF